ncbi:MAG: N-acetylglutaminylglutamine synthetase, partial [Pseudomonas sp.]
MPPNQQRMQRGNAPTYEGLRASHAKHGTTTGAAADAAVHCGWGRLLFGQTFSDYQLLADTLLNEHPGERDIVLYVA